MKKNNLVMHIDIVAKLVGERAGENSGKNVKFNNFFSQSFHTVIRPFDLCVSGSSTHMRRSSNELLVHVIFQDIVDICIY